MFVERVFVKLSVIKITPLERRCCPDYTEMKQSRESNVPFRLATAFSLITLNVNSLPINYGNKNTTYLYVMLDNNIHLFRFPSGLASSRSFIQFCFAHTFCWRVKTTMRRCSKPVSFSWLSRYELYNIFILACTYKSQQC